MESILIMGGSSFVSSSLAKHLISQGYVVDILTRGFKKIGYEGFRQHLICNRKSKEEVERLLENRKYEYIFDISAYNKEDVEILLTSVDKYCLKKYIFCSSGAVYKPSNVIIDEKFETGENVYWGKYGTDKKAAEDFIISFKIPYIIFRPTYIYGENNNLYRETYFFDRIISKRVIPMPFGKNTKTQFIHINDLVKILECSMHNDNINKIYNVTNPEIVAWDYLIETCGEVIGEKPRIKKISVDKVNLEARTYFPFRDVTYLLSIEKLKKDGFRIPEISLREGLKSTYEWYHITKPDLEDIRMDKVDELAAK